MSDYLFCAKCLGYPNHTEIRDGKCVCGGPVMPLSTYLNRKVTNTCPKRGKKKAVWFTESAKEQYEDTWGDKDGRPSRYGPDRQYVANCRTTEIADRFVEAWNAMVKKPRKK